MEIFYCVQKPNGVVFEENHIYGVNDQTFFSIYMLETFPNDKQFIKKNRNLRYL